MSLLFDAAYDRAMDAHERRADEQRLYEHYGDPLPGCSGPCRQGREPCPCPSACQIPMFDVEMEHPVVAALVAAIALVGTIGLSVYAAGAY